MLSDGCPIRCRGTVPFAAPTLTSLHKSLGFEMCPYWQSQVLVAQLWFRDFAGMWSGACFFFFFGEHGGSGYRCFDRTIFIRWIHWTVCFKLGMSWAWRVVGNCPHRGWCHKTQKQRTIKNRLLFMVVPILLQLSVFQPFLPHLFPPQKLRFDDPWSPQVWRNGWAVGGTDTIQYGQRQGELDGELSWFLFSEKMGVSENG